MSQELRMVYNLLDWLHKEALIAYWNERQDCGATFDEYSQCSSCRHYKMCECNAHITAGLEYLLLSVGV